MKWVPLNRPTWVLPLITMPLQTTDRDPPRTDFTTSAPALELTAAVSGAEAEFGSPAPLNFQTFCPEWGSQLA
jgi:hypothetical protein